MQLSESQKRHLNRLAHPLKPVVLVGQGGIGDGVLAELDGALLHHELLKVRISAGDRDLRDAWLQQLLEASAAILVRRVGNVAVLYRHNPKKKTPLALPKE